MDSAKINVLVVEPEKKPYMKEISSELSSLQHEVGGYTCHLGVLHRIIILNGKAGVQSSAFYPRLLQML